jgi:hypothetical protein
VDKPVAESGQCTTASLHLTSEWNAVCPASCRRSRRRPAAPGAGPTLRSTGRRSPAANRCDASSGTPRADPRSGRKTEHDRVLHAMFPRILGDTPQNGQPAFDGGVDCHEVAGFQLRQNPLASCRQRYEMASDVRIDAQHQVEKRMPAAGTRSEPRERTPRVHGVRRRDREPHPTDIGPPSGLHRTKDVRGLAFLCKGRMCCGIVGNDLMVRVPVDEFDAAIH